MKLFSHLIKAIFNPLLGFAKFFITTYGVFLKFFLQLNGGYWGKIGIGQYSKIERKRFFYILPFYILLALLFGIIIGVLGAKPPLMKTRKEIKIEAARKEYQQLITSGWQVTIPKW